MAKPVDDERKDKVEQPDKISSKVVAEIKEQPETDEFSTAERAQILKIVQDDVDYGERIQDDYVNKKKKSLQHYHSEKPSVIEGLQKKPWMSDRNLGLARAIADSYQAVLYATCWNPESINFVATKNNDIDNRNNQAEFTKWGMGKHEANTAPEIDGFVHNRIVTGTSYLKIYRKIWTEWVDKRIPVKRKKDGKTYKYTITTEKVRMEKGVIDNISDIDDILMPAYGKNIQELPFFIHILHLDGEIVLKNLNKRPRPIFKPVDVEEYKKKLYSHAYNERKEKLKDEKFKQLGITESSMTDLDVRRLTIDLHEWYGYYTKNGRNERFRFIVDLKNNEFLSGKPLRKINRSGKIPFSGGSLYREPGSLRSESLMEIIAPCVNAFNNVFNQKSDFQYVTNCPFGFHNPDEGYQKTVYELEPMKSYPVSGEPSKSVYFPNLSRSMAWADSDIRIIFEILEKLTGALTYFMANQRGTSGTATRDVLIDKDRETKFGIWVSRIMEDICEAVSMWFELYQDYPPKGLAERILGKDGKQIFRNVSIDTLRGDAQVQMAPDVVAGSKSYRKQLQLWAFETGQQMIWLHPQVNPRGNWLLCADTMREIQGLSDTDVKRYMGEEPKTKFDETELNNEWDRFMQGEDFDPPEGETALSLQHLKGHQKQKDEKYHLLDEEYRPVFDAHLFKTIVNAMKFMRNAQRDMMANKVAASQVIQQGQAGGPGPQQPPAQQPPSQPPGPEGMM